MFVQNLKFQDQPKAWNSSLIALHPLMGVPTCSRNNRVFECEIVKPVPSSQPFGRFGLLTARDHTSLGPYSLTCLAWLVKLCNILDILNIAIYTLFTDACDFPSFLKARDNNYTYFKLWFPKRLFPHPRFFYLSGYKENKGNEWLNEFVSQINFISWYV